MHKTGTPYSRVRPNAFTIREPHSGRWARSRSESPTSNFATRHWSKQAPPLLTLDAWRGGAEGREGVVKAKKDVLSLWEHDHEYLGGYARKKEALLQILSVF